MLSVANAVYSWQGNIRFEQIGSFSSKTRVKTEIVGLQKPQDFEDDVVAGAHVTVFFVDDYKGSRAWATSWKKLILMDSTIEKTVYNLIFCHELGHFLGLPHPTGTPHKNLMNQTKKTKSYGGRDRYGSYLIRTQIETIIQQCKWKNPKKHTCSA